jgi:FKBP-type peptidyl-prolyl cis-trans isomerase
MRRSFSRAKEQAAMGMEIGGSAGGAKMGTAYKPEAAANGHAKAGESGAATAGVGSRDFLEAYHKLPDARFKHTASGLAIATLSDGNGAGASKGASIKVRYSGWLEDGTKFDSSEDKGQPFEFKLGSGQVIQGWEEALAGAKPGERRQIVVPASLAYGNRQVGNIPPNSTLIFDIEVVSVGDLPPNPKGTMSIMA